MKLEDVLQKRSKRLGEAQARLAIMEFEVQEMKDAARQSLLIAEDDSIKWASAYLAEQTVSAAERAAVEESLHSTQTYLDNTQLDLHVSNERLLRMKEDAQTHLDIAMYQLREISAIPCNTSIASQRTHDKLREARDDSDLLQQRLQDTVEEADQTILVLEHELSAAKQEETETQQKLALAQEELQNMKVSLEDAQSKLRISQHQRQAELELRLAQVEENARLKLSLAARS